MTRAQDLGFAVSLACAVAMAWVLMACATVAPTAAPICDPTIAHRELVLCVTDADVPSSPEQMAQVVTWCAVRAALKSCPSVMGGDK